MLCFALLSVVLLIVLFCFVASGNRRSEILFPCFKDTLPFEPFGSRWLCLPTIIDLPFRSSSVVRSFALDNQTGVSSEGHFSFSLLHGDEHHFMSVLSWSVDFHILMFSWSSRVPDFYLLNGFWVFSFLNPIFGARFCSFHSAECCGVVLKGPCNTLLGCSFVKLAPITIFVFRTKSNSSRDLFVHISFWEVFFSLSFHLCTCFTLDF